MGVYKTSTDTFSLSIELNFQHHDILALFIQTSLRCDKCHKLVHTRNWCKHEFEIYASCSIVGHRAQDCNDLHKSSDRSSGCQPYQKLGRPAKQGCCISHSSHAVFRVSLITFNEESAVPIGETSELPPADGRAENKRKFFGGSS